MQCRGIVSTVAQSQGVTLIWLLTLDTLNVIIYENFVQSFKTSGVMLFLKMCKMFSFYSIGVVLVNHR